LDFHPRSRKQGFKIWQTPQIRPFYLPRSSWKELVQQYFGNGEQVIETLFINRPAKTWRHLIPFLWITVLFALMIPAIFLPPLRILFFSYLLIYLLACITAACMIGWKNGLQF
jgi:hypothetical protein